MANAVNPADTAGRPALKRVIGRGMLLCFVVGDILLGAGIYVLVGKVACLVLVLPITGRDAAVYARAGVLIAIGMALWFVNRMFVQKVEETGLRPVMPEE